MKQLSKIKTLAAAIAVGLLLASCAPLAKVGDAISIVTTSITNPISGTDIYRVKNVYAAALQLAIEYRNYCWSKPYAALVADPIARPICENRRAVVRAIQSARPRAASAIQVADKFIRENPSGNAVSYVSAAWAAVQDFRAAIPAVK